MESKSSPVDVFSDEPYLNFTAPPYCPIFTPTEEEFSDALSYIEKIKPIAEQAGICKIKPPPDWQPPFAINVDTFKFVPRVQRINELEAKIRTKMTYLSRLTKYWSLQGIVLKVPYVDGRFLDLFMLQRAVDGEGGYDAVCKGKLWSSIAQTLGYMSGKNLSHILKLNYEKIILPFVIFKSGISCDPVKLQQKMSKEEYEEKKEDETKAPNSSADDSGHRKSRRYLKEEPVIDYSANSELKKLQFYGAGPKAAVPTVPYPTGPVDGSGEICEEDPSAKTRYKQVLSKVDTYMCYMCSKGDDEDCMLLCDECDASYHTFCLIPPLPNIPKGDWRCPTCLELECSKPVDPYGFAQSKKEYNLHTFGEIADQFKSDYFNLPVHMITMEQVEKEYWRLLNTLDEDISVLYGADIHAMEVGSGFPTLDTKDIFPEDEEYISSPWNLNNLSVCDKSILKHINADVSGMKIPWCYVGMCFSTFCWHTEDHWTSSINYLHWGEPKTWYAAPQSSATALEAVMKKTAPELFQNSPDLMHQLTTTMNPYMLRLHGVPIVKADQCAGEFIVTMPRAYHSGFNHGYNFAEAVNFATADWMPVGLDCILHYRELKRQCVFSHEELVCKMAADPDNLDLNLAAYTHHDMLIMVAEEKRLRKIIYDRGTVKAEREAFELLPDDERQCAYCMTTCFFSAITCPCSEEKIVCMHCMDHLCSCPPSKHVLHYRYTLDELPIMLQRLKNRAESYNNWVTKVTSALTASNQDKLDMFELKELFTEAEEKQYPDSDLLDALAKGLSEAEKCANVAAQLLSKKARTRHRQSGDSRYGSKLSLDELCLFYDQVNNLVCVIAEAHPVKELLDHVISFQNKAQQALSSEEPNTELIQHLLQVAGTLDVELTEVPRLKEVLEQSRWLDMMKETMSGTNFVTLASMRNLLESGITLSPHPALERAMAQLQDLLTLSERWEEKAKLCLQAKPRHIMSTLESIVNETQSIPVQLPNVTAVQEALKKAGEWCSRAESLQTADTFPYLETLESLLNRGRSISVRLDQLPQLESQVAAAKSWRERTARTFLKKNSTYVLFEVLSPRTDIGLQGGSKVKKKKRDDREIFGIDIKFDETTDPEAMVAAFKNAEKQEIDMMAELRLRNIEKYHGNSDGNDEIKFCLCHRPASGVMLQCELCKDCYHNTCVPLPKSAGIRSKPSFSGTLYFSRDFKFLCPLCVRSRRPRLETILSLLVSLQKLPVRLQEGAALQCLTERSIAWQDRARQALARPELESALSKLSILSQKMVEQAAREKTEKIINAELIKAANNPDLQEHLASVTQSAFKGLPQPESLRIGTYDWMQANMEDMTDAGTDPKSPVDIMEDGLSPQGELQISHALPTEHTYSSASKNNIPTSPRKQPRKNILVPRQDSPLLDLSSITKAQLEELMMEGDLLEVSLDETLQLWKILQACKSTSEAQFISPVMSPEADVKPSIGSISKDLMKKKKRILNENGEPIKVKKAKHGEGLTMEEKILKKTKKIKEKEKKEKLKVKIKPEFPELTFPKLTIDESKKKKKFKVKLDSNKSEKKQLKKKLKKKLLMEKEDDDMNDEDCSATHCLRPLGEEVNWVQCDGCELWFHLLCVGIGDNELKEDEEYQCLFCRKKQEPSLEANEIVKVKMEDLNEDELYGKMDVDDNYRSSIDVMKEMLRQISTNIGESGTVEYLPIENVRDVFEEDSKSEVQYDTQNIIDVDEEMNDDEDDDDDDVESIDIDVVSPNEFQMTDSLNHEQTHRENDVADSYALNDPAAGAVESSSRDDLPMDIAERSFENIAHEIENMKKCQRSETRSDDEQNGALTTETDTVVKSSLFGDDGSGAATDLQTDDCPMGNQEPVTVDTNIDIKYDQVETEETQSSSLDDSSDINNRPVCSESDDSQSLGDKFTANVVESAGAGEYCDRLSNWRQEPEALQPSTVEIFHEASTSSKPVLDHHERESILEKIDLELKAASNSKRELSSDHDV